NGSFSQGLRTNPVQDRSARSRAHPLDPPAPLHKIVRITQLWEIWAEKGGCVAVPDYQTLMLPVLKLAAEGEWRVPDAAEKIADQLCLTDEEREEILPSGRQRVLHNRIHWAKFYMSKAGLIESPKRGLFRATAEGKAVLANDPPAIDNEALKAYPASVAFQEASASGQAKSEEPLTKAAAASSATP